MPTCTDFQISELVAVNGWITVCISYVFLTFICNWLLFWSHSDWFCLPLIDSWHFQLTSGEMPGTGTECWISHKRLLASVLMAEHLDWAWVLLCGMLCIVQGNPSHGSIFFLEAATIPWGAFWGARETSALNPSDPERSDCRPQGGIRGLKAFLFRISNNLHRSQVPMRVLDTCRCLPNYSCVFIHMVLIVLLMHLRGSLGFRLMMNACLMRGMRPLGLCF